MNALVIFPHQLQENHPGLKLADWVVLAETPLRFSQFRFHRQKLLLHRASMKGYQQQLSEKGHQVHYLEARQLASKSLASHLKKLGCRKAIAIDPGHETARMNTGVVLFHDLGDKAGAIKAWQELVRINPQATNAEGRRVADMLRQMGGEPASKGAGPRLLAPGGGS